MTRILTLFLLLASTSLLAGDWPWWRGPDRNGVAESGQNLPTEFSDEKNLVWTADIPGRSHGSVCAVGDKLYLAIADTEKKTQSVRCLDARTGKTLWDSVVHENGMTQKSNKKASWASGTPACDGETVYINFVSGDAAWTTALDAESGRLKWQTRLTDYVIHQGYGSSPALWKKLVIVSADNKSGGVVCGLNRKTGAVEWKADRAREPNYPSPIILKAAGKVQLFLTGTNKVTSYDPLTGKVNWEIDGATTECVTSTVTDGKHIYSSGGYPTNHVAAIAADGSGKTVWKNGSRVYVPSMLIHEGHLYAIMDAGVTACWDSATGEEKWKGRLGGNFSGSPTLVDDKIYAPNESGEVFVFRASPNGLEILARNKIAGEIFSTPTICNDRIYLRTASYQGEKRTERVVCFGK